MAGRFAVFAALVLIASLTRELTAVMLWLIFVVAYPERWRWGLGLGVVVVGLLLGLRLVIPAGENVYTPGLVWQKNLEGGRIAGALLYQGLLLPLWVMLWSNGRDHPLRHRIAIVLIPYLLLIAVFGMWQEVRLMMPVLLLTVPWLKIGDSHGD